MHFEPYRYPRRTSKREEKPVEEEVQEEEEEVEEEKEEERGEESEEENILQLCYNKMSSIRARKTGERTNFTLSEGDVFCLPTK